MDGSVAGCNDYSSALQSEGYHVVGGGKVNHHMPGFNRRSDWHVYFDQIFDSHYQDLLARGLDVKKILGQKVFLESARSRKEVCQASAERKRVRLGGV